ncbi:DUF4430 domain-containing protein [Sporosarcina sp. Te-1]|uniref:DUF4430 domain-containing protein n=1 Tax=Sporosarcina sp. Te-1 TaxID=2818390 RepID=UPI001A9FD749|nr:DUF4430 domain-containing protein [Sporosarcina sp. Te-1]QTD40811.1 DUF4430 domain-containing protein [Sporosarcina sp. Te-1]
MRNLHKQLFSVLMSLLLVFSIILPGVQAAEIENNDEVLEAGNAVEGQGDQSPEDGLLPSEETADEQTEQTVVEEGKGEQSPLPKQTIPVKVRIESYDKTILPPTEIDVAPYDITHAVGDNGIGNWYVENDEILAIHAIIKALEDNGFDVSDKQNFEFGEGNFITNINGLEMNSVNPYYDGWMYFVNNEFAPVGVGEFELEANDEVTLFFTTDYGAVSYSWYDQSTLEVAANEDFTLKLQSVGTVDNAVILVNDQPLLVNGEEVRTDAQGAAKLRFTEPGEYHLSAKRMDGEFSNITRPYSKVVVHPGSEPTPEPGIELTSEPDQNTGTESETKLVVNPASDESKVDKVLGNLFEFYRNSRNNKDFFPGVIPELSWTEIVGLQAAGFGDVPAKLPNWIETDPGLKPDERDTLHIRYIFAMLALGKDPSKAWTAERNLFAELAAQQNPDTGAIGAVNKHMWAMHALDTGEKLGYNVGNWNAEAKSKALKYLLGQEKQGGGFAFSGSTADPDMTGMALLTLVNYQDDSAAAAAIERSKQVLRQKQLDTAGWGSFGSENSNSIATAISGLVAIGEDPLSENWKKGDLTPLDALQRFQLENGAFTYTLGKYASTNMMATEQSLIALQEIKTGKSAWHQFAPVNTPAPEPEKPAEPDPETPEEPIGIGSDEKEYTLPQYANDNVKKPIILQLQDTTLPKITAERAGARLEIPGGTKITSSNWNRLLQVPTKKTTAPEERNKITQALQGSHLNGVTAHIKVGGDESITFDRHVTLRFAGLGNQEAGFIDASGKFTLLPKENNSSYEAYAYKDQNDLVIKTKHFTDFLVFDTTREAPVDPGTPENPTNPAPPASPSTKTILFSVEKRTMGQGDIIAPTRVDIQDGDTAYTVLRRVASEQGISIDATGVGPTVYVKSIDGLGEFDGGPKSGWMYSVNGEFPQFSAGIYELADGDNLRWQYTKNLGEDLGNVWDPNEKPSEPEKPGDSQKPGDNGKPGDSLKPGGNNPIPPVSTEVAVKLETAIKDIQQKLLRDGVQSEWEAIGLYKSGITVPSSYLEKFRETLNDQVISKSGKGRMKITDVERLVMAANVLGIHPTNADSKGFNLLEKIYNSELRTTGEDSLTFQGNNGVIFALIALDSKNHDVPENAKWNRDKLVKELLKTQKSDGSWSLEATTKGPTSIDITAMALTALAPYNNQQAVSQAIDKAVQYLSNAQGTSGGFQEAFVGGISSEATSQVIIGLTANGIDPRSQAFTKNNTNLIDHLLRFKANDGGFKHLIIDQSSNGIATEQALQALVAFDLYVNGKGALYSFTENGVKPNPTPTPEPTPTPSQFKDTVGHWAADYIQQAVEQGLVKGYADGTFKPNQSLTRAQAVSILVRALELETDKKNPFTDTQNYAKETQSEIAAAYHHGLIKLQDGKFRPSEKVTRAQMALLFYRAYEIQNGNKYKGQANAPFADMKNYDAEAKEAVNMLYALQMASGENGKYMPGASTTRAQATKMLMEFLNTK